MKFFLIVWLGLSFLFLSASEHVMVWTKTANLYNEQGRAMLVIQKGDLVEAVIHPKDRSLYVVIFKGKRYNAAVKSFRSLEDMVVIYKKILIDYQGVINRNNLRVSAIESDLLLLYVQSLELRRDTAIAYKKVSYSGSGQGQVAYRSMLRDGDFKKLMKVWSKEHSAMIFEKKGLASVNLRQTIAYEQAERKLSELGTLIKAFSEKGSKKYLSLYVKNSKGGRLYKNNVIAKYVPKGLIVQGVYDTAHAGWYKVLVDKVVYRASAEDMVVVSKYLEQLRSKKVAANFEVSYLKKEVESHEFRLKLYQGISRQLQADKFVAGGYGIVKNYVIPIDQNRTFTLTSPDANKLYINSHKAIRVLEEWKVESTELSKLSLSQQKRILDLQKADIDYTKVIKTLEASPF